MGRPGMTEEEVIGAIEALLRDGFRVTVNSVRKKLGRGSPNTINRYLRDWRDSNKPETVDYGNEYGKVLDILLEGDFLVKDDEGEVDIKPECIKQLLDKLRLDGFMWVPAYIQLLIIGRAIKNINSEINKMLKQNNKGSEMGRKIWMIKSS